MGLRAQRAGVAEAVLGPAAPPVAVARQRPGGEQRRLGARRGRVEDRGALALVPPAPGGEGDRAGRRRLGDRVEADGVGDHRGRRRAGIGGLQRVGMGPAGGDHPVGAGQRVCVQRRVPGPGPLGRQAAHRPEPGRHAGMGDGEDGDRRLQPRRLRQAVELDRLRPDLAREAQQRARHADEVAGMLDHPVQRLVRPDQLGHRLRLRPPGRVGARAEARQHRLDPHLPPGGGEVEGVAPDAAHGVERHQDPARAGGLAQHPQARSSAARGWGRCSWMSLNCEKAPR